MTYDENRTQREIIEDFELRGISVDPATGRRCKPPPPPAKPSVLVIMSGDYGYSGLWSPDTTGKAAYCTVEAKTVELPDDLAGRLESWVFDYWELHPDDEGVVPDFEGFNKAGRSLAAEVKRFVGEAIDVYFAPEPRHDLPATLERIDLAG